MARVTSHHTRRAHETKPWLVAAALSALWPRKKEADAADAPDDENALTQEPGRSRFSLLPKREKQSAHDVPAESSFADDQSIICRYVTNYDGDHIGETLSTFEGRAVLKQDDQYFVIPIETLQLRGEDLALDEDAVDWDAAKALGQRWLRSYYHPFTTHDDEIPPE